MKKKLLVALLTAGCVMSMTACGETKTDDSEVNNTDVISTEAGTDAQEEDNAKVDDTEANDTETDATEAENAETDVTETNNEEAGTTVRVNSERGYSMTYDTTAFTLTAYDGEDSYDYNDIEGIEAPIYVHIQKFADQDAQTLAEEMAQSYEAEISETNIAAGILAKAVNVTSEHDGIKEVHTFYAIPAGEGSVFLEINSYVGAPEISDSQIEEMLASFTVNAETDVAETNSAEAGTTVCVNSERGYSMTYDTTAFKLTAYDGQDCYDYNDIEGIEAPIYVHIQKFANKDKETLAAELSQPYEVEVCDNNFATNIPEKVFEVVDEHDGIKQLDEFHIVSAGKDSILVEISSYVGAPEISDSQIEEMIGTFTVNAE